MGWKTTQEFELPPKVTTSDAALDYLNKQNSVMSEITTKMQMMQRERDKYEDMIAEEMEKNKQKAMESKLKDYTIQKQTLEVELEKKLKDTDSKKVKELKNTFFQFTEERDTVVDQVEEAKAQLKRTIKLLAAARTKAAQLNIELGELKIILEGMKKSKMD